MIFEENSYSKFRSVYAVQPFICKYLGEPVDAASGHMTSHIQGFELSGIIPFKWDANYYSDSSYNGPLGKNMYHSYDMSLQLENSDGYVLMNDTAGRPIVFPVLAPGESFFNPKEKFELHCDQQGKYAVSDKSGLYYYFEFNKPNSSKRLLTRIANKDGASITFNYTEQGNLYLIRDSMYRNIDVKTDNLGRITSLVMDHPVLDGVKFAQVQYQYDQEGRMVRFYDAEKNFNELTWNKHLITSRKFSSGIVFTFEYDKEERCTAALNSNGIFSYWFSYFEGYTKVTNSEGSVSTYYHKNGIVNSLGAEQIFVYY